MSKTSSDLDRHAVGGQTMGTRWSAIIHATPGFDPGPTRAAMACAVSEIDDQMSTWNPDSDLMRLNRAVPGKWQMVPEHLMTVIEAGLAIGQVSGGAFDIGMGDAVTAWGFAAPEANPDRIRAALRVRRRSAHEVLEIDRSNCRMRKHAPLSLDLCGIAKGYGVDRLAETARDFGITSALVSIDGELRAIGNLPDGRPWGVAVERPDHGYRAAHSILALCDCAVATSGDYRHWIDMAGNRLSHTMDPTSGAPLTEPPGSVTVVAPTCCLADAWATAMMVLGANKGLHLAQQLELSVLFLDRSDGAIIPHASGPAFETSISVERPMLTPPQPRTGICPGR